MSAQPQTASPGSMVPHSDGTDLIGTWKLVSCFMEDVETKKRSEVWGAQPNGYLTVTPGGRWIVVQTAQGRKIPQTADDLAAALRSIWPIPAATASTHGKSSSMLISPEMRPGPAPSKYVSSALKTGGCTLKRRPSAIQISATNSRERC